MNRRDLWSLVVTRAEATPDAVLGVDEHGRELTFAAYRDRSERVAAGLAALGVGEDTRVSWQLPTSLEAMVLVGALGRLGAVQNPVLPIYRERELRFVLGQVQPAVLVVTTTFRGFDHRALAQRLVDELRVSSGHDTTVVVADPALPEGDPDTLPPPPDTDPLDEPTRWIFYTSGTTADPKGALHTDGSIAVGAQAVCDRYALTTADRYPVVFPFTHIGGVGMLVAQLLSGCGAVCVEQVDPETTPELLGKLGVTVAAGGTPMALVYLAAQRRHPDRPLMPGLRAVMTGAAPKPPDLHEEIRTELGGVGAVSVYGLTEAPFLSVSSIDDPADALARTEGRPIPGVEVKVVGDDGRTVPVGATGEIRARGPLLCRGYLDPSRDAESFDEEGFLRTGDLGSVDARGFVSITGRLKDIIIRKGENISAKEVEDVLYAHPAVADVAVVGLPDRERGERCCAVLVTRDGADPPTLADVVDWCRRAGLANQKIPEQLDVVDELPRNASGKVLKYVLRERLATP